jgi:pyruvate/2-oxoglutarate dehydrogenase complex dihydrolipoamide acyltransferase (E2) component
MPRLLSLLALGVLLAGPLRAQPATFDAASLDALFDQPPRVEVNLGGSLLRIAAAADDDPGSSGMLRGLRGITVRVYSLDGARADLRSRLDGFGRSLAAGGWQTMVRVRPTADDPDDVSIFVRESGDAFDGMVVMSLDEEDGEASFVFLDGLIDLASIADLSDRFAGTDLDAAQEEAERARDDAEQARERAQDAAEQARERAQDAAERARDEAERIREDARIREEDERIRREDDRVRREDDRFRREAPPAPPAAPKRPAPPAPPAP